MKRIVIFILVCIVGMLLLYVYKLHSLAVEGNEIFAIRCTQVNPHLITSKNSFLKFSEGLKNPKKYTLEETMLAFDDYISYMRLYVDAETAWLEINDKFINHRDYKLIEPWYIQKAGEYGHQMYLAQRDYNRAILELRDSEVNTQEIQDKLDEAVERKNKYEVLYYDFFDEAVKISDPRKIFGRVPIPEVCTEENMTIPNTSGSLDADPVEIPPDTILDSAV